MFKFINDIKYKLFALKEKFLLHKLKGSLKSSFSNSTGKTIVGEGADLSLQSGTIKVIQSVKENVSAIVKNADGNPELLLDYVKAAKTQVYRVKNAAKILRLIKEEEGFLCEKRGLDAVLLSVLTGQKISLKTVPMFVFDEGDLEKLIVIHNFYRWFSFRSGLSGFDYDIQKKFKASFQDKSGKSLKHLSVEDIVGIKEAVARDNEASEFTLYYSKSTEEARKFRDKLKKNGKADV